MRRTAIRLTILLLLGCATSGAAAPACEVLEDRNYTPRLLQLIDGATRSVRVMMFEATYYERHPNSPSNRIISSLIEAAGRGVDVQVILDRADPARRNSQSNLTTARRLRARGVRVFLDPPAVTTHTKLLLVDSRYVVCGSTNWTYSAMARNHEVSLLLDEPHTAAKLEAFFLRVKASCSANF